MNLIVSFRLDKLKERVQCKMSINIKKFQKKNKMIREQGA